MGKVIKGPWSINYDKPSQLIVPNEELEFVAFDVETTGFNRTDRIVEIGLVVFKNGEVLEEWCSLINPLRDVGKTQIHGITASMVSAAPIFEDIANDIFRLINKRILVAHNLSFDTRMLAQELNRIEAIGDFGKGFCTMMASRHLLPGSGDSLGSTCEALNIEKIDEHSALGDARMTMQIFKNLQDDGQLVAPAKAAYISNKNPSRTLTRPAFKRVQDDALERIRALTQKVPFPTSDEKYVAYLLLLNMTMQDLVISKAEEAELSAWAEDLGISESEVDFLHRGYLDSFIQAALRDGVITSSEREMIDLVGKALRLPVAIPDSPQKIAVNDEHLCVGKRICFTGEAIGHSGETIGRSELEALASKVGLHPVSDVTKKGCDILVAADESTMSGKAKKAKDWGIPVISVEKFITYCTFGK